MGAAWLDVGKDIGGFMPFEKQQSVTITPTATTDVEIFLRSPDPRGDEPKSIRYRVGILRSDGTIRTKEDDLMDELTIAQKQWLNSFVDEMRAKATTKLLP